MYEKNLQGDVVAILNSSLTRVVEYSYDAWGNIISTTGSLAGTLGVANPIRYRSYYYDTETGCYYLQSRYYNPTWGRFISADVVISGVGGDVLGYNMFAYCMNNPINMSDDDGNWPKWIEKVKSWFENTGEWIDQNFRNSDGTYSLYDNHRSRKNVFREQVLSVTPSGPSYDLRNGKLGLGSIEANVITGGWEWEYVNLSLLDFGHVEAGAEYKDDNVKLGALASVWSPSVSFSIGKFSVNIGAEVCAIGVGFKKVDKGFSFSGAYGFGGSLTFSWKD